MKFNEIPTKPGYYWFQDDCCGTFDGDEGQAHLCEIQKWNADVLSVMFIGDRHPVRLAEFREYGRLFRFEGPIDPPRWAIFDEDDIDEAVELLDDDEIIFDDLRSEEDRASGDWYEGADRAYDEYQDRMAEEARDWPERG